MREARNHWPLIAARLGLVSIALAVPLALVSNSDGAPTPQLVRQPYIQNATASSIEIVWKTNTGGTSVVRYGASTAYAFEVTGDPGRQPLTPSQGTFIHHVTLAGLQPDTRYRYQVLTNGTALTPVDADYFFDTAPPNQSTAPFTFAAMGDMGDGSSSEQLVADMVSLLNPDIYLGLGDIVYDYSESLQDSLLFVPNAAVFRNVTWYPTCGNHDDLQCYVLVDNHALPRNNPFMTDPTETLRRPVYSFDYGNAHFVSLDSNLTGSAATQQLQWAQADLANSTATWKIVYWHFNAWSTGSHNSFNLDAPGMSLAQFAIQNDVDVALWGHSHTYERFNVFQGVQFFTAGNGGQRDPTQCVDHVNDPSGSGPRCLAGELENEAGVLLGSVSGDQIKFCQWNEFGASQDGFTLTKGGAVSNEPCPPPAPIPTLNQDIDGDGYKGEDEALIGTDPDYPCGIPGWPSNLVDAGLSANKLDVQDIVSFVAPVRLLDKSPGPGSPYNPRWDLRPGADPPFSYHINIVDLTALLSGPAGSPAYPSMFGGLRALNQTCPYAP